jgi:hypothetical protein
MLCSRLGKKISEQEKTAEAEAILLATDGHGYRKLLGFLTPRVFFATIVFVDYSGVSECPQQKILSVRNTIKLYFNG